MRLVTYGLRITPAASLARSYDVAGNAVAMATFWNATNELVIESAADIQLDAAAWPVFDIAASAISYPFPYSNDERADLGSLALNQHLDPAGRLQKLASGFVLGRPTNTLSLLKDINAGVWSLAVYEPRDDGGAQSPLETLHRGRGSCRDLAILFAEVVRSLGFSARIVSGYLHDPDLGLVGSAAAGSTHAWAEVYVPGAGWIAFDPTNQHVGGANLIPVAVGRDIRQSMPVSGSYVGSADAFASMSVDVSVAPTKVASGL